METHHSNNPKKIRINNYSMFTCQWKKIKVLLLIVFILCGFLFGRYLVFYISSVLSFSVAFCANLISGFIGIASLIGLVWGIFFKNINLNLFSLNSTPKVRHKTFGVHFSLFLGGILFSISLLITFYGRGIDAAFNRSSDIAWYTKKYTLFGTVYDQGVGIVSKFGNVIIPTELSCWINIYFNNETNQKMIVALQKHPEDRGPSHRQSKNGDKLSINVYTLNGNLIKRLYYKYNLDSDILLSDEIGKIYGYPLIEFFATEFPIETIDQNSLDEQQTHSKNFKSSDEIGYSRQGKHSPQRHESTVPVQVWHDCINCFGSRQCPYCQGQGIIINAFGDNRDCPVCTDGLCVICGGRGGHYETEYQTRIEYY